MKRLIIICIALLLIGCTRPEQPVPQEVKEPVVEEKDVVVEETIPPKEEPKEEIKEERAPGPPVEKEEKQELKEISPELKRLLERADNKITSFSYYPSIAPEYRQRNKWIIRGNKVRIDLFQEKSYQPQNYFDTVFLDIEKETAKGYCLGASSRCGFSVHLHPFDVPYNDFKMKTPYEWVKSIDNGEIIQTETLGKIVTKVVRFVHENEVCDAWIGEFSGLVIKVKCGEEKPKVIFQDLAVNSYTKLDVTPPITKR